MKNRRLVKWLTGMCLTVALGAMTAFPALAGIDKIKLVFADSYEVGTILEPQVYTTTNGVEVESVEWSKDPSKWKPGQKVNVTVTLDSDQTFSSSYNAKSLKITGGTFVSAKRESGDLIVKASYYPVVQLAAPESAGWSKQAENTASWKKVDYATGYQLKLYCEERYIRTINTTTNKVDLTEYMTQEGYYYYEVRATGKDTNDYLYFKYSDYTTSGDKEIDDLGDTDGKWKTYRTGKKYVKDNGEFATNEWYKIIGKWYYFDETSHAVTGWIQLGPNWYYMDQNGIMQTGWIQDNGVEYYLNKDGSLAIGWVQKTLTDWHYYYPNGTMAVNTVIDGYAVNEKGIWSSH